MNFKATSDTPLTEEQIKQVVHQAFEHYSVDNEKVLVIIPDTTRTAPMPTLFRTLHERLGKTVEKFDILVALGTHPPLSDAHLESHLGIQLSDFPDVGFYNHHWDSPEHLYSAGTLPESKVSELSGGMLQETVNVTLNKLVRDYDKLIIIGPVFPHEVVGMSGGSKYLFPGISGPDFLNLFHWLGALITSSALIGKADTPVRRVINEAAKLVKVDQFTLNLVMDGRDMKGLYIGDSTDAWNEAAEQSRKMNTMFKPHPFDRVLSCAPEMYDDLWTGAKCMYKLEPVVADGGELIIYAPHITEISKTHGKLIEQIGYHVRDYFTKQSNRFKNIPGGIRAHSTHVKGLGTFENGIETPRIQVSLATGIPKEICEQVNLGYVDPLSIDVDNWGRDDERALIVPHAGEKLYRLENDPFGLDSQ
ncbi:MAG: lactate racemase domain-containing protein [candidate division KSB1 bacterium]|nr:lactate racemase domain-containing protein [candidate division KSB1 bacterium]